METTIKIKGIVNWQEIINAAQEYKYVVMYRDHYRGNGKGEYFESGIFRELYEQQGFWFRNTDRPVHTVILTNDDVPGLIARRKELINAIDSLQCACNNVRIPYRPACDGRATRRTQPDAFAEWDTEKAAALAHVKELREQREAVSRTLNEVPYYSTTLLRLTYNAERELYNNN